MTPLSSPHTHTSFVDGENTAREMVEAALKKGFKSIGFTEHSHVAHDVSCSLPINKTQYYIEEVLKLKEEFKGKIEVYLAIEFDSTSDTDLSPYDYVIGSVHYLQDKKTGKYWAIDSDKQQFIDCCNEVYDGNFMALASDYYSEVVKMAKNIKPDIIAHYDLITKFGSDFFDEMSEEYQNIAKSHIKEILQTGAIFEINSGAVFKGIRKFPYPSLFLIDYLHELNAKVIISSDAHCTDALGFYWDEMILLLKKSGFNQMKILESRAEFSQSHFSNILI